MDNSGFLKSVSFGGFDKKDVLAYVDDLNTKIYNLESELEDAKAKLGEGGGTANIAGAEEYEQLLAKERAKANELMANNDTLKLTIQSHEDEIKAKDAEIEQLKEKITELENNASVQQPATSEFDIGSVFVEAKNAADRIIAEARNAAKKMNDDAKELAEQVVDEANNKATDIVSDANSKANKIVADAEEESKGIHTAAEEVKKAVQSDIRDFSENVAKLNDLISGFSAESLEKLDKAKTILNDVETALEKGEPVPAFTAEPVHTEEPAVEEAVIEETPAEAVEEAPAQEEAPSNSVEDILSQFAFNPEANAQNENYMDVSAMESTVIPEEPYQEEAEEEHQPLQLSEMM